MKKSLYEREEDGMGGKRTGEKKRGGHLIPAQRRIRRAQKEGCKIEKGRTNPRCPAQLG